MLHVDAILEVVGWLRSFIFHVISLPCHNGLSTSLPYPKPRVSGDKRFPLHGDTDLFVTFCLLQRSPKLRRLSAFVSWLSFEELVTGLVMIHVWIPPIFPAQVDAINLYKHKFHQTYCQNVEVYLLMALGRSPAVCTLRLLLPRQCNVRSKCISLHPLHYSFTRLSNKTEEKMAGTVHFEAHFISTDIRVRPPSFGVAPEWRLVCMASHSARSDFPLSISEK